MIVFDLKKKVFFLVYFSNGKTFLTLEIFAVNFVSTTCNARSERDICTVDRTFLANVSRIILKSVFLEFFRHSRDDFEIDNFNKFRAFFAAAARRRLRVSYFKS